MQKPIRQEVTEWKQHKVTKYLIESLERDVSEIQETWAAAAYTTEMESGTIQLNSQALGSIKAIREMLDFISSDMGSSEEKPDYEH